jgi:glycosyltransferase involved in cell wall biosynthesis
MNIIFVIDDLYSGGAQRQMVNLAIKLKKDGCQVVVLTYYERDYYGDVLNKNEISIICLARKSPIKRILAFRKFLRTQKVDIVISYLGIPNFICELAAFPTKKWKLIVNERSANPFILKSKKSKFIRYFHCFSDVILTNSYANKELILKVNPFVKEDKIRVIYNIIDLEFWKPIQDFEFKKDGKLRLIVAASHRYLKNFKGLLEAINRLNVQDKSKLSVTWFGHSLKEPYYDESIVECKKYIEEFNLNKIVSLKPATLNIKEEMLKADVVGLFSFFEGLPNVICEGMALGKPILATSISDVPILVEDNVNGILCDPNNSHTITEGLKFFLEASSIELKSIGDLNRLKAIELFDNVKILKRYNEVI